MAHSHLDDGDDARAVDYIDDDDISTTSSTPRSSSRSREPTVASAPALPTGNTPHFRMPSAGGRSAPPGGGGAISGAPGDDGVDGGGGGHLIGTPGYVAPEVIRRLPGANAPASDMWSAGVVLYILLSGKMPFYGRNDAECLARTASGAYAMPPREWSRVSPAAISLVRALLCVDPTKRLTAAAALQHPWLACPSTLSASPLDNCLAGLHSSRRKFRRAVMACITMQRMQRAVAAGRAAAVAAPDGPRGDGAGGAPGSSAARGVEPPRPAPPRLPSAAGLTGAQGGAPPRRAPPRPPPPGGAPPARLPPGVQAAAATASAPPPPPGAEGSRWVGRGGVAAPPAARPPPGGWGVPGGRAAGPRA